MNILFTVVVGVAGALVCRYLAGKQGLDKRAATLWGLFLGPVAIIVYLAMDDRDDVSSNNQ